MTIVIILNKLKIKKIDYNKQLKKILKLRRKKRKFIKKYNLKMIVFQKILALKKTSKFSHIFLSKKIFKLLKFKK